MKKIYQTPEVDILDIMSEDMIADSPAAVEDGFNTGDAPTTGQTSGNLSRQKDMWETYEDPEY